ncbi:MAG: 4Fe-4S dicluster domain-containing protein [Candidatus Lokiarchaeota archaeon]|nr:4Fe-4S dicluster domain-containing protein [Candidatus Lokiarchaeota archaeon]
MNEDVYYQLRKFLDKKPIGFPSTKEETEIEILKRLFTEEEARIALLLNAIPEPASRIARRGKLELDKLKSTLSEMAKKGLVFKVKRNDKTFYNSAPFMIGLYEYSVKKIDKRLAELYRKYYDHAFLHELGSSNVPGFKVIPLEETIESDIVLYPYQQLEQSIKKARSIAVTECICRKEARILGDGCDFPIETCLSFGAAAEFYIENEMGRRISAEEAINIVKAADEAGLVHAGANTKHLSNLCNCCPCCCASMKGITKFGMEKHRFLNAIFESIVSEEDCIGCGNCIDRCPVGAIEIKEFAIMDRDKCLGCGLCSTACPEQAIKIVPRDGMEEPFKRMLELGREIMQGKLENQRRKNRSEKKAK